MRTRSGRPAFWACMIALALTPVVYVAAALFLLPMFTERELVYEAQAQLHVPAYAGHELVERHTPNLATFWGVFLHSLEIKSLEVKKVPDSALVLVTLRTRDPLLAARMVNKVAVALEHEKRHVWETRDTRLHARARLPLYPEEFPVSKVVAVALTTVALWLILVPLLVQGGFLICHKCVVMKTSGGRSSR